MKLATFLPALAVLGLSGCVTGYGYSDDGYYYGRPSASVGSYGSIGYGTPGGWGYGYGLGYGAPAAFLVQSPVITGRQGMVIHFGLARTGEVKAVSNRDKARVGRIFFSHACSGSLSPFAAFGANNGRGRAPIPPLFKGASRASARPPFC